MESSISDKLKSEGWVQRFTASGERLAEAIDNYRALGYEVKTVPVRELNPGGCAVCFGDKADNTFMLFTRECGSHREEDPFVPDGN